MKARLKTSAPLLIIFFSFINFNCSKNLQGDLIIKNVNVVDVESGNINKEMDVVIIGDSISAIEKHETSNNYEAEKVIDGTDKFLIPGLWDMHTHTWWGYQDFFPLLIANGVTGIRDLWGDINEVKRIREEIKNKIIAGPEIVSSGSIVDGKPPAWPGSDEADTPGKGREIVRRQKEEGADFIKVYSLLERDVYFAIADECKKQSIPFSGHIPRKVTLEEAVNAGQQTTEHFDGLLEFTSKERDYYYSVLRGEIQDSVLKNSFTKRQGFLADTFDEERLDHLIELLSKSNMWVVPTSIVNQAFGYMNDPEYIKDDRIFYLPDYLVNSWDPKQDKRLRTRTDDDYQQERNWYHTGLSIMKKMKDGGVKFLGGTDYSNPYIYPGFSLHDELEIFVDSAGFTPLEALQTVTINPAVFLNRENEFGTVVENKIANLIILNDNPLEDINNTRKISSVILRGEYFDGDSLRTGIEKIAAKNRLPKIKDEILPVILSDGADEGIKKYHQLKKEKPEGYNFDETQLNSLGYTLLEKNKIDEAIKIFKLNVEVYPEYANGYDSLGDAYAENKDTANAVKSYEKAVAFGMGDATKAKLENLK